MSERKYRQRGYQAVPKGPRPEHKPAEKKEYAPRGQTPAGPPKTLNMPGYREVVRCRGCGNELTVVAAWAPEGRCTRCGADLHACAQCVSFDTGAPLECLQAIPARVSPKVTQNTCTFFEPRTTVERETKSAAPTSARSAFDDLFK
jgi:ribosomal protein S27E